jgi:heme exporter protein D
MDLGPHAEFIVWAYAGVALLIAGLILYIALAARRVAARLKALEDRGIRRRSAGSAS